MNPHGRRYEHELVNGLDEVTAPEVWTTTVGYSGNASGDACDLVVTLDTKLLLRGESYQVNIEAKKRQGEPGKRVSGVFAGGETDETGVAELQRFVDATPEWADPIVAIKFDRRKLCVLDATELLSALGVRKQPMNRNIELLEILDPRLTPSENVSMVKPVTSEWPSARTAADDAEVLAEELGLPVVE
jgi:hypothetical protein